jgi:hypothetical protein
MNIFLLDLDPRRAAQAHADKHVVKMLLEACQLLYTAHWIFAYPELLQCKAPIHLAKAQRSLSVPSTILSAPPSLTRPEEPGFRPCHIHHPCAVWVRESLENYLFAADLACELTKKYMYRYQASQPHACAKHAEWLRDNSPGFISEARTPFVLAMDDKYKLSDPIESYRNYYRKSKKDERDIVRYTRRIAPDWL